MRDFEIRKLNEKDLQWIIALLTDHWGAPLVVVRGRIYHADQLPGFIAIKENHSVGLATYNIEGDVGILVSLDSLVEGIGIGTELINAVRAVTRLAGCKRLSVTTTNDNTHALHFYQKRGFVLKTLYSNIIEQSRKLKPQIPLTGIDGIPLRDELELELALDKESS
ncbi:MAG: N-acetyltransferase GCN5 [Promethearchaeota archaeon CR_4]|nr:MAG: N-acetyltransferase GCN5 [Candidatus Lokiarchaeota archaeon CR_4]